MFYLLMFCKAAFSSFYFEYACPTTKTVGRRENITVMHMHWYMPKRER